VIAFSGSSGLLRASLFAAGLGGLNVRVLPSLVSGVSVLFLYGCATDAPPEPVAKRAAPARPIVVTVKERCTTTIKPENICAQPKPYYKIETCAEAYYRYTVCKDLSLDGGKGYPRNGYPCQDKCSKDALTMVDKIIERPFTPRKLRLYAVLLAEGLA
jgi:hypothetical protein